MRVLIYSVSAGAGHMRAADAVLTAFKRYHPDVEAEHVDVMKLVPAAFRKAYADSYLGLVNSLPSVWGWLYAKSDQLPQTSALASVRKFVQRLNTKDIIAHAAERKPDVILTTHFLPAEIFSDLAKQKQPARAPPRPPLAVVVTDHDVHQLWVHPNVDRYYTASDEIAYLLAERAVDAGRIKATGIPCDPIFGDLLDEPARQRLRKMLGLAGAPSPVLLLNAHGCGVTGAAAANSLAGVVNNVFRKGPPKTVLVVCGRNEKIKDALAEAIKAPDGCTLKMYGFVTNMHELLGISDLTVTKPGGLSTSECLARCVPMVLVSPIPGQEERNAEMLLENGCAVLARTPVALSYKLETLLNDPARLARMREACRRTGKPHAAADIAADVVELARR
ncbi:MAG: glycosyltransferase [Planctomycetota bacterium]|nr:glycosyltransferase [Planctomycetota bacterium]